MIRILLQFIYITYEYIVLTRLNDCIYTHFDIRIHSHLGKKTRFIGFMSPNIK